MCRCLQNKTVAIKTLKRFRLFSLIFLQYVRPALALLHGWLTAKINSAIHPSGVGKSSTKLSNWGQVGMRSPVLAGIGNTV